MERPLLYYFMAAFSGLIIANYLVPTKGLILSLAFSIILLSIIIILFNLSSKTHFLVLSLICLSFFLYFQIERLAWQQAEIKEILGVRSKLSGIIQRKNGSDYIIGQIKNLAKEKKYNYKIKLRIWDGKEKLQIGDKILFESRLKLPRLKKNPGGFSYRNYLQKKGIYAVGDVSIDKVTKLNQTKNYLVKLANLLRSKIKSIIKKYFNGTNQKLMTTLLLGIDKADKVNSFFKKLGLSHLLVISGFHIGVLSYLLYIFISCFKLSLELKSGLITLFLIVYLTLINWQLPAIRASLLVVLALVAKILDKKIDLYNILAGIALWLLIINPWYLFMISFQLSFIAVVMISYLTPVLKEYLFFLPEKIKEIVTATLAAQIGLGPILIYYFHQISLLSLVTNLILMPLISVVLLLSLCLLLINFISPYLAVLIAFVINFLLTCSLTLVKFLADNYAVNIFLAQPSIVVIFLYYIICYYVVKLKETAVLPYSKLQKRKIVVLLLSLIIIIITLGFESSKDLEVVFFAVGLGDGIYIETPKGNKILIDGGSTGQKTVSFLRQQGIRHLDLIFISHFHNDHVRGVIKILEEFEVEKVFYPPTTKNRLKDRFDRIIKNKDIDSFSLSKGDYIYIDKLKFFVLHPSLDLIKKNELNNNSLVLKLTYKEFQLLLTGDIEKEAEQKLVASGLELKADFLKIAHHGSNTSSTKEFLERVRPDLSIMSVGKNKYNLPDKEVENRLKELKIQNLRTDKEGAVIIKTDGKTYSYQKFLN